jgi:2-hydroxychromene-2-carboxylate isomerase
MEFTGRVYFDFASREVFRFFQIIAGARREGAEVGLEWRGYATSATAPDRDALAASELVRADAPQSHGAFVQAMLAAVHVEGMGFDADLIPIVAKAAGVEPGIVQPGEVASRGEQLLAATIAEAEALGVSAVPTVYRHGPAVTVRTTPAVLTGSALRRLELIDAMLEDDGVWGLTKP